MKAADLFAGGGGLSEGAEQAGCEVIWAANHWQPACDIYRRNHPKTEVSCQDLRQADFTQIRPFDILLAAPACQGHSKARGKEKPHHDALRSTAWAVVDCLEAHPEVQAGIVENVPEFMDWALFPSWVDALQRLGWAVSPHVADSADHGVPQHRERALIVLTRSKVPLQLKLPRREHVPVSSIIDWSYPKWSRVVDKVPNTQARVANGRREFGRRFVMPYYGSGSGLTGRSLHRPVGTITTKNRWGVVDGDFCRMFTREESRAAMGVRRDYILPEGVTEATFMLGNMVCPPVARDYVGALMRQA